MKTRRYIIMLAVALAALSINAQNQKEDLHKEITLDKDFVPVEKKATKKNALPAVARPKLSTSATKLNYSDWVQPTEVTTDIPTLLPYGYRTAHLFNDKRGYFLVGGGTQANFTGAFGYRIVDTEKNKVALWLQHNSSWNGRNSSMELPDGMERVKQQLNDNLLKLDYTGQVGKGTLELGLNGHLDNFNYYGGWMPYNRTGAYVDWGKLKQTYHHVDAHGAWSSSLTVRDDHEVSYNAGLQVGHSGYAEGIDYNKGIQETAFTANVGAGYTLASGSIVGLNINGEYLKHNIKAINDNYSRGMITFNPYYTLDGARYHLHAGVNMHVSMSDGATLRFSPDVRFDAELAGGLSFFASATGGKDMGYIDPVHTLYRYAYPVSHCYSIYTPVDAEAGFAIGPFAGFTARLAASYAIVKGTLDPVMYEELAWQTDPDPTAVSYERQMLARGAATHFVGHDARGFMVSAELGYKYRSLVDAKFRIRYAPSDDDFNTHRYTRTYDLGAHGGSIEIGASVDVTPIKPLTLNVGFDFVGERSYAQHIGGEDYIWEDMRDIVDLHLGASYRIDKSLSVWARASNLLNKRWDIFYGMGAQRINAMVGLQVTF